mmetsp:Transcript_2410/g.4112  ORF Transcript_2410/g.4112 Transcript_2410/m.4112 type:complete len:101 (-) Transcript_2410:48-350(-)
MRPTQQAQTDKFQRPRRGVQLCQTSYKSTYQCCVLQKGKTATATYEYACVKQSDINNDCSNFPNFRSSWQDGSGSALEDDFCRRACYHEKRGVFVQKSCK